MNNYIFFTGSSAGGTLLYIVNHLVKTFLVTCNKYKLEFAFIEITNPDKSNIIMGVIYKNSKTEVTISNNNFLTLFRLGPSGMWGAKKSPSLNHLSLSYNYKTYRSYPLAKLYSKNNKNHVTNILSSANFSFFHPKSVIFGALRYNGKICIVKNIL